MSDQKRIMVIGLDGLCKKMIQRFAAEGIIPNMARLVRRGTLTRLIPVVPAQTPTNWTTLATGAYPGTHGVTVWGTHEPGQPITECFRAEAMSSNLCRAEYFWEAAARQGLNSLLVNYVGYPPTCDRTYFIEWAQGPTAFYFQLARPGAFRTAGMQCGGTEIGLRSAQGWTNLPRSRLTPLETELAITPARGGQPTALDLALIARGAAGYDTALIARTKDAAKAASCRPGKWTDWMTLPFRVKGRSIEGGVRFKLIELSGDASAMWLYQSQVYPLDQFTYPPSLGAELTQQFGPFVHEAAWAARHSANLCDDATCVEQLTYHAQWVGKAVRYLFDKLDIRVYYQHYHLLDSLNHKYLSAIDPYGIGYGRIDEDEAWAAFRQGYQMVDRMVGEVTKAADQNTVVAVCSDHSDVPNRRAVSLWNLFLKKGWVTLKKGADGQPEIDRKRTKVHYDQNHLWLNVKGREPQGCVKPGAEYEALRDEILDAMLDVKDRKYGKRAIAMALKREDAACLGMYGPAVGDIVFYYAQGYRWSGPEVFRMGKKKAVVFDDPGGANHGPQIPTGQTEISDNAAALILAGPGVRKSYVRDPEQAPAMSTADLVPTLAHLAAIEPPQHAEGKVVRDLLVGARPKKRLRRRRIDTLPAKPPKGKKVMLAGDVTDEEQS